MSGAQRYQPERYAQFRPTYPPALFQWLASIAPARRLAWDCGTGSGQAALGLARHFDRVVATDIDRAQLARAPRHPRVSYLEAAAEHCGIEAQSTDLVTVACAVHWFDRPAFYREVKRVLRPGGTLVVWAYTWPEMGVSDVDRELAHYRDQILGPYWPASSQHYFQRYRTLEFPFAELQAPRFSLQCDWDAEQLLGFLSTWAGPQRYRSATGQDSTEEVRPRLTQAWQAASLGRGVELPLYFRVGRVDR